MPWPVLAGHGGCLLNSELSAQEESVLAYAIKDVGPDFYRACVCFFRTIHEPLGC